MMLPSSIFSRPGGPRYYRLLHTVFLGFLFSMIFGHAPIILPAITGVAVPYRQAFYAHLALLHISLAIRLGGDLLACCRGVSGGPAERGRAPPFLRNHNPGRGLIEACRESSHATGAGACAGTGKA